MNKSTKFNIGFVLDDSLDRSYNGVQQYVITLGNWLSKNGHNVHYLVGDSLEKNNIHSLSKNVGVAFNKNKMTIPLPANKIKIRHILNKHNFDVLHIQMPYSPYMAGRVIELADKNTAIVGTFHIVAFGKFQLIGSKFLAMIQKNQLTKFDKICSVSSAAQSFAKKQFNVDSVIIPNAVDIGKYENKIKFYKNKIVYLGRLEYRKGCIQLLKAINKLPDSDLEKIEVVIAGDGSMKNKLESYATKNNLNMVNFVGYINDSEKISLLSSAGIAIFPSLGGESFGIVLIEAMAAGSGVVLAGDNEGYKSVLDEVQGSIIDPTDTVSFANTIHEFINNKEISKRVRMQQSHLVKKYDISVVGNDLIKMYKNALLNRDKNVT